jgi:hypothetical protein
LECVQGVVGVVNFKMSILRECDWLEEASNFTPWKCRLKMLREEIDLWSIVKEKAIVPIDLQQLAQYEKEVAKVKRIILDSMKDHLIPHIVGKLVKEMHEVSITLYQSVNIS